LSGLTCIGKEVLELLLLLLLALLACLLQQQLLYFISMYIHNASVYVWHVVCPA
jgi:membrane protein DedA with SNARE-associated domain